MKDVKITGKRFSNLPLVKYEIRKDIVRLTYKSGRLMIPVEISRDMFMMLDPSWINPGIVVWVTVECTGDNQIAIPTKSRLLPHFVKKYSKVYLAHKDMSTSLFKKRIIKEIKILNIKNFSIQL